MNTISLFAIQTGQDGRTLIKFLCFSFYGMSYILRSPKIQKPKRKWLISRHLDCASLVNKEFSIVKPCN